MDTGARQALLRQFGIDYLVMQKDHLNFIDRVALQRTFPVAFENEHFLVFAASGTPSDPPRLRSLFAARFPALDGSIPSDEIEERMPPLVIQGLRGRFLFETASEGDALRVKPLEPDRNGQCLILFGYTLDENGFTIPAQAGDELALLATVSLARHPKRPTTIFIQDKTDQWQRRALQIGHTATREYGVAKTIRSDITSLSFGICWEPDTMDDSMEIRNLKILVNDAPAVAP